MKVLLTGANGQLGHDVLLELIKRGHQVIASDIQKAYLGDVPVDRFVYMPMDITNKQQVEATIKEVKPEGVIHCAAYTAVDKAQLEENREIVKKINVDGTENIAISCKLVDCKLIYISTDYVFSGLGDQPYKPDDKNFKPCNYYGESKLMGEMKVIENVEKFFIVRIAWVFGLNGTNFIKTMLKLAKSHNQLRVVNDQIGTPTYTLDLARLLVDMIESEKYGFYHATNEGGYISWYEFAKEIFRQANVDIKVDPVSSQEYGQSIAMRPYNSRLDKAKLLASGFKPLPDYKDALARFLKELDRC